ncbi:MAG: nucleotidyltransferase [Paenisporosarcina sp.]
MKFTENQLAGYATPLSATEDQQCKNAIRMVIDAIKPLGFTEERQVVQPLFSETYAYSQELRSISGSRKIKLFIQGSYANNTNVRTQSDVDIAVVEEDIFQTEYRQGVTKESYGFSKAETPLKSFKDEIEESLRLKFGADVERQSKSIKIHGNTYRKDADGVPCRRFRDYRQEYLFDGNNYVGGIVIVADTGERIINYPEQHIKNGKEKNVRTNHHYKKMVRIMKKMRHLMKDEDIDEASKVSSFGLESLLWNIDDNIYLEYGNYRKVFMFNTIVNYLVNNQDKLSAYYEANGIKMLCSSQEEVTNMKKFIIALADFYEYE